MPSHLDAKNQPILNFAKEKVALGPLRQDLIPLHQKWNNDFAINITTRSMRPVTQLEEAEAFEQICKDKSFVFFTIYEKLTNRPIGLTYLSSIEKYNAEFNIVIGEKGCHGKGYGTEATTLMLDYAFTILGLQNVMLKVYSYNEAGIRAYEKAGFKEIGRRRQAHWINGQFWDVIYMDCIASEFESPVLKTFFE